MTRCAELEESERSRPTARRRPRRGRPAGDTSEARFASGSSSSTPDRPRAGQQRRFTAVEALVVLTLLLTVMLFLGRFLYEVFARYRTIAAVRHITAMTLATRLQAAEANRIAVLFLDMKNRRIVGWIERGTPNFRQDPEEPATQEYELPSFLVFRRALAGAGNEPDAVGFDTYNGDRTLVDRVIFQPDGTLVRPEAQNWSCPGYVDTFILWEKGVHDGQDPCAVFFGVSEADGGVGSHGAEACGVSSGV